MTARFELKLEEPDQPKLTNAQIGSTKGLREYHGPFEDPLPTLGRMLARLAETDQRAGAFASLLNAPPKVSETAQGIHCDLRIGETEQQHQREHRTQSSRMPFALASGKQVQPSKEALEKAQKLLSDGFDGKAEEVFTRKQQQAAKPATNQHMESLASEEGGQGSKAAKKGAESLLFADDEKVRGQRRLRSPSEGISLGFASGKEAEPSATAKAKAQALFASNGESNGPAGTSDAALAAPANESRRGMKRRATVAKYSEQGIRHNTTAFRQPLKQQRTHDRENTKQHSSDAESAEWEQMHHLHEGIIRSYLSEYFESLPFVEHGEANQGAKQIDVDTAVTWSDGGGRGLKVARQRLLSAGAKKDWLDSGWLAHHFRLVVWKLAAYERAFPNSCGGASLTMRRVVEQLQYRYEREMNRGHAPPLKRILEQDIPSWAPLNLCVTTIRESGTVIEVTDGWYCIHAGLDDGLQAAVKRSALFPGQKIAVAGMQASIGDPLPALKAMQQARGKVYANGVRRLRWDARLGYGGKSPFAVALSTIRPDGGPVPALLVRLIRKYRPVYLEEREGQKRTRRSEPSEEEYENELERKRLEAIEDGAGPQELEDRGLGRRTVNKLVRFRVRGYSRFRPPADALMTLWNPGEEVEELSEGNCYKVTWLAPVNNRFQPHAWISLKPTAKTRWREIGEEQLREATDGTCAWTPRRRLKVQELKELKRGQDVDLEGIVLHVSEAAAGGSDGRERQGVFLADGTEEALVFVERWGQAGTLLKLPKWWEGKPVCLQDAAYDGWDGQNRVHRLLAEETSRVEQIAESKSERASQWATSQPNELERLVKKAKTLTGEDGQDLCDLDPDLVEGLLAGAERCKPNYRGD